METSRYLQCLAADYARLRAVANVDLAASVPTCPGWTIADLVRHVGEVYLHKVECMRLGLPPQSWPPDLSAEAPVALLDRAYAALTDEFATRSPDSVAATWYEPDQTVGFWVRRMAQETVVHRVDAELAAGKPVGAIPADLAIDGVDEVLDRFLVYGTQRWPEEFAEMLPTSEVHRVLLTAGEESRLVRIDPTGAFVESASGGGQPAAISAASSQDLLLWLWRRSGEEKVRRVGDQALVDRLRELLGAATQ